MKLDEWVRKRGDGALTFLQVQTGLSYTAVHRACKGKSKPTYETALRIAAATGGAVSPAEICAPLLAGVALPQPLEQPSKPPARKPADKPQPAKAGKRKPKVKTPKRRAGAQLSAAAALA